MRDPDLWSIRDCIFDAQGKPVRMFWEAEGSDSNLLPGQLTFDPGDRRFYQTHVFQTYPRSGTLPGAPDRVTLRVHLSAVGADVLSDLISSGDLGAQSAGAVPSFLVGPELEWTPTTATEHYMDGAFPVSCVSLNGLSAAADKVLAA